MTARTKPNESDPRVQRTRELIRNAFVDLLAEMDLEKITVNRITGRATINRVTFYLHYRDIPDMIDKITDDIIHEMKEALSRKESEPLRHEPETDEDRGPSIIFVRMLEYIEKNAKLFKLLLATKRVPLFTERFMKLSIEQISSRIDRLFGGSSSHGVAADIGTWYIHSAYIGTIIFWLQNDMPYRPRFLAEQIMRLAPRIFVPDGE